MCQILDRVIKSNDNFTLRTLSSTFVSAINESGNNCNELTKSQMLM